MPEPKRPCDPAGMRGPRSKTPATLPDEPSHRFRRREPVPRWVFATGVIAGGKNPAGYRRSVTWPGFCDVEHGGLGSGDPLASRPVPGHRGTICRRVHPRPQTGERAQPAFRIRQRERTSVLRGPRHPRSPGDNNGEQGQKEGGETHDDEPRGDGRCGGRERSDRTTRARAGGGRGRRRRVNAGLASPSRCEAPRGARRTRLAEHAR